MRSQFAFYKSFDDVYQDLNDKQKLEFINTILDVQFLRVKIDDVSFKDTILKHIWNAQKHSIEKSINGYLDSQKNSKIKNPYMGVYDPLFTPSQIPMEGVRQEEQEKEQVKKKVEYTSENDFTLSKQTAYSKTSKEYKENLEVYLKSYIEKLELKIIQANSNKKTLPYSEYILAIEAKDYKYANFVKAYRTWNMRYGEKQ